MVSMLTATEADKILEGIHIVDCDSHMTEPPDLWTSRAPAHLKSRMPVHKPVDGATSWFLDGEQWAGIGGNTISPRHHKNVGVHILQPFNAVDDSAWDWKDRLSIMDEMGVWAATLYANGIGFASNHIVEVEDKEQRLAILQIYNDYLAEIQHDSGGRLIGLALLPMWDRNLLIREAQRIKDLGLKGVTLSDRPELLDLPELDADHWTPMWEFLNDLQMPVNFHIGAGFRRGKHQKVTPEQNNQILRGLFIQPNPDLYWSSFGPQRRLAILASQMYMSNARVMTNMLMSNIFDRFPHLKIVSVESGIGWIPFILESLEYQLDEMVTDDAEMIQKRRPTEYFRDHFYATFWFETSGPEKLLKDVGVNNVLIETDIPHPTCLYPGAREHFASVLSKWEPEVRRRVLQDNAVELFKLDLPKTNTKGA